MSIPWFFKSYQSLQFKLISIHFSVIIQFYAQFFASVFQLSYPSIFGTSLFTLHFGRTHFDVCWIGIKWALPIASCIYLGRNRMIKIWLLAKMCWASYSHMEKDITIIIMSFRMITSKNDFYKGGNFRKIIKFFSNLLNFAKMSVKIIFSHLVVQPCNLNFLPELLNLVDSHTSIFPHGWSIFGRNSVGLMIWRGSHRRWLKGVWKEQATPQAGYHMRSLTRKAFGDMVMKACMKMINWNCII